MSDTILTRSPLAPSPLNDELAQRAGQYAAASMAPATRRAYRAHFRHYSAWCAANALDPLPASGDTLALYLTASAGQVSVVTLAHRLAAIRGAHKRLDMPAPESRALDMVWAGIRRTHGRPSRGKAALDIDLLRRALASLPNTLQGKRDRALLLVGFGAALRRSELAGLHMSGESAAVTVAFVSRGLEIHIDRAKTDQEGRGAVVAIPLGADASTCAATALRAWLDAAGVRSGAVFRSVDRWQRIGSEAIADKTVARVVKAAAIRAGCDPSAFAGHSLRAGLATSAAENDAPGDALMEHMRHASFTTTKGYIRAANRFKRNPAALAGM